MEDRAEHRRVLQFHAFPGSTQEQTAPAHVAAPDEVGGKPQPAAEDRREHLHVLGRGHAAEEHHVALRANLVGQAGRAPLERPTVTGVGGIDVAPGTGPVADSPLRTAGDLARLRPPSVDDIPYVAATVEIVAAELGPDVPVLAFAGAPFTVASYLIEGRPSRDYRHTKALMHTDGRLWNAVMESLTDAAIAFSTKKHLDREQELVEFFKGKGLEIYEPDVDAFRSHAQAKYLASDLAKDWPEGMLEKINAL